MSFFGDCFNVVGEKNSRKQRRRIHHYLVVLLNVCLIGAALSAASLLYYVNDKAGAVSRVQLDSVLSDTSAPKGERVINLLLVGSDSSANLDPDDPIRNGRKGERLGDVIIVAHIDEPKNEVSLLSFPRDLWVHVPEYGRSSKINASFELGGPSSLIDTIEHNFDIPIHHYVNVDFAGFKSLIDAVGSVNVYFETAARDWNTTANPPRTQTGFKVDQPGCHTLDADQALAYVRSRYYQTRDENGNWRTDPTADLGRISRQQDFLRRVAKQAIDVGARNPIVLNQLISSGLENVTIDERLTPALISDLAKVFRGFNPDNLETYSFPARDATIGERRVLIPSASDARPLLAIFQGVSLKDETSVNVSVLKTSETDPKASSLMGELKSHGFAAELSTRRKLTRPVATDYFVQHGPDGVSAAELVAAKLNGTVEYQEYSGIMARNVQVVERYDTPTASQDFVAQSADASSTPEMDSNQSAAKGDECG